MNLVVQCLQDLVSQLLVLVLGSKMPKTVMDMKKIVALDISRFETTRSSH